MTSVTDADDKETDLLHDDRGNLVETVSPDTGTTRFLYDDAAGNLVQKIEDATPTGAKRSTFYSYDGLNRLTAINLPNDPDWTFTYDTSAATNQKGRLAQVTNGAVTTQLEYTQRGDVAVERTIVDARSYAVSYTYDAAGNRASVTTPDGTHVSTAYAALRPAELAVGAASSLHRIKNIEWYPFGPRIYAEFSPFDHATSQNVVLSEREVNLRGQVTRIHVTGPAPPESSAGELLDRAYTHDHTAGAPGPNDAGPNLDRVVDALDATESRFYFYDELDRLAKATDLAGATLHEYGYDAVGNRTSKLGAGTTSYSYESATNRLAAATGAEAADYAHDAYGSRIYDGAPAFTGTPSLLYDDANRLIEARDPANGFATLATYTYDAFGRRVMKTTATQTFVYLYDTEGHLIEEVEKKATTDYVRAYVFLEDELVGVVDRVEEVGTAALWSTLSFRLPDARAPIWALLAVTFGGAALLVLARRNPAAATATTGALLAVFTCAGTQRPPPSYAWVHTDPLGTPLAVTSVPPVAAETKVIWRASYEPFGRAAVDENPDGNTALFGLNVRLPGQYEDAETGWHHNFFRDYDPETGRYHQADPIGQVGGMNLFAYVSNAPTMRTDSLGLLDPYTGFGRAVTGGIKTAPFVSNYFGRGQPLDLGSADLGFEYENATSVQSAVAAFNALLDPKARDAAKAACTQCPIGGIASTSFSFSDTTPTDVTREPGLFAVGDSSGFARSGDCRVFVNCITHEYVYSCSTNFTLDDIFTDPLDGERIGHPFDLPFGSKFPIRHAFDGVANGGGRFR